MVPNGAEPQKCIFLQVPFASQCEHHLLPFYGKATIALVLNSESQDDFLGLGMREATDIVRRFSRRLQVVALSFPSLLQIAEVAA